MPVKQTWKWVKFSPFQRSGLYEGMYVAFIRGLRSDDTMFAWGIPMLTEDNIETIGLKIDAGFTIMNEFLSCSCQVGSPCDKHRNLGKSSPGNGPSARGWPEKV